MRVLVGCEFSGAVRREFRLLGHDAWSCDFLPAEDGSEFHIRGDVLSVLDMGWDIGIFFTPCTFLCNSGVKHLYIDGKKENGKYLPRWKSMNQDGKLFKRCLYSKIPKVACENPIPHQYALRIIGRKYDQIIQPWQFGHGEQKSTCLWLRGLPKLFPTNIVSGREQRIWKMSPSDTRGLDRSRTYEGIAKAMATQWGS